MTVYAPERGLIVMEGICSSEDAEVLLQRLLATPTAVVDLITCESLHAAVIQVLLAAEPQLRLPPAQSDAGCRLQSQLGSIINVDNPGT